MAFWDSATRELPGHLLLSPSIVRRAWLCGALCLPVRLAHRCIRRVLWRADGNRPWRGSKTTRIAAPSRCLSHINGLRLDRFRARASCRTTATTCCPTRLAERVERGTSQLHHAAAQTRAGVLKHLSLRLQKNFTASRKPNNKLLPQSLKCSVAAVEKANP